MKYHPIGDEISIEGTLIQAAMAIDVSAKFAQKNQDPATMITVAESWMKLADFMAALRDHESKQPDKKQDKVKTGFQRTESVIDEFEITLEDEENARSSEDASEPDCDD